MLTPATYNLWSIGCQMNEADALRAAALLEAVGYRPVEQAQEAEFLLLNTCVVRQQAEDKIYSRLSFVRELKQRHPERVVALMGCLVGKNPLERPALQERFPFIDVFLPPSDLSPLQGFLEDRGLVPPGDPDLDAPPLPLPISRTDQAIVAHVPIVLGCSHACTYCVIPYRRGGERSRPSEEILAEAAGLAGRGVRELVLLGQIVDRYGLDRPGEIHLPTLLEKVADIPGILRVRFLTSHPSCFTQEMIHAVARNPRLCPYFELPVQSGSDPVLAAMRRGYSVAEYERLIARIRRSLPHAGISTDMIVGFPGETETCFEESMALMRRMDPDMIRIAKYSPRALTYSARRLRDDVPEAEKERRRVAMEFQLRQMLTAKHAPLLGETVEILVEGIEPNGRRRGRTGNYKLVFSENSRARPGEIAHACVTWAGPFSLIAREVSAH